MNHTRDQVAHYISPDPDALLNGAAILAVFRGVGASIKPLLKQHGILTNKPMAWMPLQVWLDVLQVIEEERDLGLDLVGIGAHLFSFASLPPDVKGSEQEFDYLSTLYRHYHRGDVGNYFIDHLDSQRVRVISNTPYPWDMDYGIIYAFARRLTPDVRVAHEEQPCRLSGDHFCTFLVEWD